MVCFYVRSIHFLEVLIIQANGPNIPLYCKSAVAEVHHFDATPVPAAILKQDESSELNYR
jgi:hypothetical protein